MVKLSQYDTELNVIDLGEFQISQLDKLFQEKLANTQLEIIHAEENIAKTCFILSRNDKDFVNVSFLSYDLVQFDSDRLIYPKSFTTKVRNIFRHKSQLSIQVSMSDAKKICQDYITFDREAFEGKYQQFYSY